MSEKFTFAFVGGPLDGQRIRCTLHDLSVPYIHECSEWSGGRSSRRDIFLGADEPRMPSFNVIRYTQRYIQVSGRTLTYMALEGLSDFNAIGHLLKDYGLDKQKRGCAEDRRVEHNLKVATRHALALHEALIESNELHLAALVKGAFLDGDEPAECDQIFPEVVMPPIKGCPCPSHHPTCDCDGMGGDR